MCRLSFVQVIVISEYFYAIMKVVKMRIIVQLAPGNGACITKFFL